METKNAIIGGFIGLAYGCITWIFTEVVDLKDNNTALNSEVAHLNRTLDACVSKDVYEVDKLLFLERMKNRD